MMFVIISECRGTLSTHNFKYSRSQLNQKVNQTKLEGIFTTVCVLVLPFAFVSLPNICGENFDYLTAHVFCYISLDEK